MCVFCARVCVFVAKIRGTVLWFELQLERNWAGGREDGMVVGKQGVGELRGCV